MELELVRYSYAPSETEGWLYVGDRLFHTIEDPWRDNKPFQSCIPEGLYTLEPHRRPTGVRTWALVNPDLNIYHRLRPEEKDGVKRDLCLIHKGNWELDVEGCIAPGLSRLIMVNPKTGDPERAVASSGAAMAAIRSMLGEGSEGHTLLIRQIEGAHLFG